MKIDRRVMRTRGLLRDALLALIAERGYDDLTIEHITARANLRRATFYMHYRDKDELLLAALTETFDDLARETAQRTWSDPLGGKTQPDSFLVTFKHAEAHHTLYRTILSGTAGAMVARRVRDYLAGVIGAALRDLPPERLALPAEVLANYLAGAELSMIQWWLEHDRPYSAEQMAAWVHQLALKGASSGFVPPLSV